MRVTCNHDNSVRFRAGAPMQTDRKDYHFLIKNTNSIIKDYKDGNDILEISKKYNGSPLNIMRIILLKTKKTREYSNIK